MGGKVGDSSTMGSGEVLMSGGEECGEGGEEELEFSVAGRTG